MTDRDVATMSPDPVRVIRTYIGDHWLAHFSRMFQFRNIKWDHNRSDPYFKITRM